jgi:hypothetical protein
VTTEAFTRQHLGRILDFANRNNIPAMFEDRLMSYGPGYEEGFRTAAVFVSNLGSANISRFSWQRGYGTFYLLKSLPANGRASRPRRVLPTPPETPSRSNRFRRCVAKSRQRFCRIRPWECSNSFQGKLRQFEARRHSRITHKQVV